MVCRAVADQVCAHKRQKGDGWYLLRRGTRILGHSYPAGSVVERVNGSWYIHEGEDRDQQALPLDSSMVCEVSYDGVSLFVVERDSETLLHARPVSSPMTWVRIDPMLITMNIQPGDSHICARFGRCFLPLEFFGW